jgi:YHS domain-containing protein
MIGNVHMQFTSLFCNQCKHPFQKRTSLHKCDIKRGRKNFFCSNKCKQSWNSQQKSFVKFNCFHCGKQNQKQKRNAKSHGGPHFCNTTCANLCRQKGRTRACTKCQSPMLRAKRGKRLCDACKEADRSKLILLTKGEYFRTRTWQAARNGICKHARRVFYASKQPRKCSICSYAGACDVAHKVAVSDFSDTALISEINALTNLVCLCKQHHWDFDHS